jgi:hypothetical protein
MSHMQTISRFERSARIANYGHVALSDEQLQRLVPSAFAATAHESRSDRYAYIPTSQIIAGLRDAGFVPMTAKQGGSRIEGKADFTKHMIRFRYRDNMGARHLGIGGVIPEVALINSHDGTSAYKLIAGMLRLVCLNGMLVADREFGSVRVGHTGDVRDRVIEASFEVLDHAKQAIDTAGRWSGIAISRPEQQALAEGAHMLRFADANGNVATPIAPDALLAPRRAADRGDDLWTVTSRIQENVIRGGLHGQKRDARGRARRVTSQAITGIDQDVKLNRALWALAERMAEIKAAS